jgi:hypothetical protein
MSEWVERQIAKYEERVGKLPVHNKQTLRAMLMREEKFWDEQAVRVDNNTGHDDQ